MKEVITYQEIIPTLYSSLIELNREVKDLEAQLWELFHEQCNPEIKVDLNNFKFLR